MYEDLIISKQKIETARANVIQSQRAIPIVTKSGMFAQRGRPQQERLQRIENKRYGEQLSKQKTDYTKQLGEITQKVKNLRKRDRRIIENNLIIQQREDRRRNFPDEKISEKRLSAIPKVIPFVSKIFSTPKRKMVRETKRYRSYM